MEFSYSDYAVDYIDYENDFIEPWRRFVPDQFLAALEDLLPRMDGYWSAYERANARGAVPNLFTGKRERKLGSSPDYVLIRDPHLSWSASIALADKAIERFSADMGKRLGRALDKGWVKAEPAEEGEGTTGFCDWSYPAGKGFYGRIATLDIKRTGTIADAAAIVHEAGHFLAGDYAAVPCPPPGTRSRRSKIVAEVQSFFLEEMFHDPDLHADRPASIARAVSYHAQATALLVADRVRSDFSYLWDTRRAQALKRQKKLRKGAIAYCGLHMTPYWTAMFIAAGLYSRYRAMPPERQALFLGELYPVGVNAVAEETENASILLQLLALAGAHSETDLKALFHEAADRRLTPDFEARPKLGVVAG